MNRATRLAAAALAAALATCAGCNLFTRSPSVPVMHEPVRITIAPADPDAAARLQASAARDGGRPWLREPAASAWHSLEVLAANPPDGLGAEQHEALSRIATAVFERRPDYRMFHDPGGWTHVATELGPYVADCRLEAIRPDASLEPVWMLRTITFWPAGSTPWARE